MHPAAPWPLCCHQELDLTANLEEPQSQGHIREQQEQESSSGSRGQKAATWRGSQNWAQESRAVGRWKWRSEWISLL